MTINELRNKKIKDIINKEEAILSDIELQLLMFDSGSRVDNGDYNNKIWFDILRKIARKNDDKKEVMDTLDLKETEILLMQLGETAEEIKNNAEKYYKIATASKDVIGVKLDKYVIKMLLDLVDNYKPTQEENDEYYDCLIHNFLSEKEEKNNVIHHAF